MKTIPVHDSARRLCVSGVIAAVYSVLTFVFGAFSFGPVQLRISEALCLLPILIPEAIPGLALGCLLSNLFSPLGATVYDVVFGTLATLLSALLTRRLRHRPWLAAAFPVLLNALIVGAVLTWAYGLNFFWMNVLTVGLGEAVSCYAIGLPLVHTLRFLFSAKLPKDK